MKKDLIVILGGGESGVGAAILANKYGLKTFLSDSGKISNKYKKMLIQHQIPFEEKGHSKNMIMKRANKIIKSPGIAVTNPFLEKIKCFGIPILSELEFGKSFIKNSYIISITGSNGKTTTCKLIYKILQNHRKKTVGLAGNIGHSFSKEILKKKEIYVLEVSSFQLDDCLNFRSNIAVILNIKRDHLNRYDHNIDNYINSKLKIAIFQKKEDILVYNYDDPILRKKIMKYDIHSQCIPFSIETKLPIGAYLKNDKICIQSKNRKQFNSLNIKDILLIGNHNIYNVMASLIVSQILNIDKKLVRNTISKFKPMKHRMEYFFHINGVRFINDSKATNVNSVFYALDSIHKPIIWIVGGYDKGNDYHELIPLLKKKVKAIICLGKKNKKIMKYFENMIDCIKETRYMKEAVRIAYKLASYGDCILLSPACSSFDLFKDYKEKGNKFKKEVKKLFNK